MSRLIIAEVSPPLKHKLLPWLIFAIGAIFYCYEYLLRIEPSLMTNELMKTYHLTGAQYGNLMAFFYYAYTPMQLLVGVLMDRYGPRYLLTGACLACVIGSLLFANSHILIFAEISRLLIGLGSAFAFVGALKLASIWLPPERFAFVAGLLNTLGMLGAMTGDITLTKLIDSAGWRHTLFLSAWVGVILMIITFTIIHDRVEVVKKVNYQPESNFRMVLSGLLKSLKYKTLWINGLIASCLYLSLSAFAESWGIPYLMQTHHASHMKAASMISMVFLGWAIGGPLSGWLSDYTHHRRLPILLGTILAAITISIVLYFPGLPIIIQYILLLCFGIFAGTEVIAFAIAKESCPSNISGTAVSLTNALVMLGGVLLQPCIGWALDNFSNSQIINGVHVYATIDYQRALMIIPISLIIAALLTIFLPKKIMLKNS